MAKIDKETLSLFRDADDLVGYIALHRYEPENANLHESEHFRELPQYMSDIIYILDFETLFDIEGLFTFIENTPGKYLPETIDSFERTGNGELAGHLRKVQELMNEYGLSSDDLHAQALERALLWKEATDAGEDFDNESDYPELREAITAVEEALYPLMDERDYWDNVKNVIKQFEDSRVRTRKEI